MIGQKNETKIGERAWQFLLTLQGCMAVTVQDPYFGNGPIEKMNQDMANLSLQKSVLLPCFNYYIRWFYHLRLLKGSMIYVYI